MAIHREDGELVCIEPVDDQGVFLVTVTGEMFALIRDPDRRRIGARARTRSGGTTPIPGAKVNVSPMILSADALLKGPYGSRAGRHRSAAA